MSSDAQRKFGQKIRFAVVNLAVAFGQVQENFVRMAEWTERLASLGAEVVAFPEMSICGYGSSEAIRLLSEQVPGPSTQALIDIAAQHKVLILAGLARQDEYGNRYISQLAVSADGLIAVYDKIFLSPNETLTYSPGENPCVFSYKGWSIGMQLCYDTHFPALSARLALNGADILFMGFASPHETPDQNEQRLMRYLPARAYDNSCYVVSCNQSGVNSNGQPYPGVALALDAKGKLLDKDPCQQKYLMVEFDRSHLDKIRNNQKAHFLSHHKSIAPKGSEYAQDK